MNSGEMKSPKATEKNIFDVTGRVALVTGGGHGLGREYCIALAQFGADVVCNDLRLDLAQETVELLKAYGHRALALQGDIAKQEDVERVVSQAVSEFGRIDILFCNAGIMNPVVPFHELEVADWDRVMGINLRGTFLCIRTVLPIMRKQKKGSIIATSSVASLMGSSPMAHCYSATKAGINALTRHIAVVYAKEGIRANAILPGVHDTRPVGMGLTDEDVARLLSHYPNIPMGRFADPKEIRGLAVYLASDASSFVTGQLFIADGGRTA